MTNNPRFFAEAGPLVEAVPPYKVVGRSPFYVFEQLVSAPYVKPVEGFDDLELAVAKAGELNAP